MKRCARPFWPLPLSCLAACAAPPFPALGLDSVCPAEFAEVLDVELRDVLRVGRPVESRDDAGRLTVSMMVRSIDHEPIDVLATVRFLDVDGRQLPDGVVRRHLRLEPDAMIRCEAGAPVAGTRRWVAAFDWDK
ncbi:MAG: hypothetical protein H6835_02590 [Planctomycetes bacterium]|nr:hypothetical protein [Planctomycetota bacterium]